MAGFRLAPLVEGLPRAIPFVGPETLERRRGRPFRCRLGANENAFGPSPAALHAMTHAAFDVWKYGDPENHALRERLAAQLGCRRGNVVVGEGIDGLLGLLVRMTIGPGDAVVTSAGAYPTFNYHVTGFGGVIHTVPYRDDHEDLDALVEKAHEVGARLVYLANPDNPMGTVQKPGAVEAALERLPDGALLVLDEAYVEFADPAVVPDTDIEDPRIIRLRTFSKVHAMAGARIGYAFGAESLIGSFDRVRNHFGVNRIAQEGALAALDDADWLAETLAKVAEARKALTAIAADNGLTAVPSSTNFVAIDCGGDGRLARAMVAALADRDVFVRMPAVAPLDRCIRVSAGRHADLAYLAEVFPKALGAARTAVAAHG